MNWFSYVTLVYESNIPYYRPIISKNSASVVIADRECLHGLLHAPFLLSYSVFIYFFHYFSFLCCALDKAGHLVSF